MAKCKILIGKILTNCWEFVKFINIFPPVKILRHTVVGLMVQSAPVSRSLQKQGLTAENSTLESRIYCASSSIRNDIRWKLPIDICTIPKNQNANIDVKTLVDTILNSDQLSLYCRNFIIAMSLKHQLQDFLFDNAIITPMLGSDNIQKLSQLLTNLQTMATAFDDLQYNRDYSRCVRLSAAQYKIICYVRHPANTTASLNEFADEWYLNEKLYIHKGERHTYEFS